MNPCKPLVIVSILVIAFLSACSEKDEFAPFLEGDIIGYAYCADEYGDRLEDNSGIKVVTGPGRKYSAITDKNGRYVLKNVITGTYDLSFEKEDFGTMKSFGIQHLGGTPTIIGYHYNNDYVIIYKNITTQITSMSCVNDTIIAELTFSGEYRPWIVYTRLFFSSDDQFDLSSAEAIKNFQLIGSRIYTSYADNVSSGLPFAPGETVFCKAAIYSNNGGTGISTYYDFETKTIVYPNISHETFEFYFTMP